MAWQTNLFSRIAELAQIPAIKQIVKLPHIGKYRFYANVCRQTLFLVQLRINVSRETLLLKQVYDNVSR